MFSINCDLNWTHHEVLIENLQCLINPFSCFFKYGSNSWNFSCGNLILGIQIRVDSQIKYIPCKWKWRIHVMPKTYSKRILQNFNEPPSPDLCEVILNKYIKTWSRKVEAFIVNLGMVMEKYGVVKITGPFIFYTSLWKNIIRLVTLKQLFASYSMSMLKNAHMSYNTLRTPPYRGTHWTPTCTKSEGVRLRSFPYRN